jgi:hypothetical protein
MMIDYPVTRLDWRQRDPVVPWVPGSFQEPIATEFLSILGAKTPTQANKKLFATNNRNTAAPAVTLNQNLWCKDLIDLSPISVINNSQPATDRFPVILVHQQFVYCAAHVRGSGPYVFMAQDGTFETRTVLQWWAFPTITVDTQDVTRDASIGILSAPITTITPASILAPNIIPKYPPGTLKTGTYGSMQLDYLPLFRRKARRADTVEEALIDVVAVTLSSYRDPTNDLRAYVADAYSYPQESSQIDAPQKAEWYEGNAIGGDSGSPVFYSLNGKMILWGAHYTSQGMPAIDASYDGLLYGMRQLATAHGLTDAATITPNTQDLSAYFSYA